MLQPEGSSCAGDEIAEALDEALECGSRRVNSASVQAVTRVNAEQALYEAFEGKHYLTAFFAFFIPVSLFDLEFRFSAPTYGSWRPARAGTALPERAPFCRRFAPLSLEAPVRPA
jgi:hypothetical protein